MSFDQLKRFSESYISQSEFHGLFKNLPRIIVPHDIFPSSFKLRRVILPLLTKYASLLETYLSYTLKFFLWTKLLENFAPGKLSHICRCVFKVLTKVFYIQISFNCETPLLLFLIMFYHILYRQTSHAIWVDEIKDVMIHIKKINKSEVQNPQVTKSSYETELRKMTSYLELLTRKCL